MTLNEEIPADSVSRKREDIFNRLFFLAKLQG
jgi:hypothetical protein